MLTLVSETEHWCGTNRRDEQNQFCNYYDYFLYNFIILLKTLVRTQTFVGFTLPHIKNFILFFVVYDQQSIYETEYLFAFNC